MSQKKKTRPTYSTEFKAEAVRKCRESSLNQVSRELGVAVATLRTWLMKAEVGPSEKGKPSYEDLERQIRKLKKELGYVSEINEILKKSTAIFSNDRMGGLR